MNILDIYLAISFILFLIGLYSFIINLIKINFYVFLYKKGMEIKKQHLTNCVWHVMF
jgi:hypothetical protein